MCTNKIFIETELNCVSANMYDIETIHTVLCIRTIGK